MAKLTRKLKKIFSVNSPSDIGVWGSINATTSTDPDVIQSTGYETGISAAEVSGKKILPRKDFNGVLYDASYHLAYLYQSGIPEYDATTTYYIGDVVRIVAGGSIYTSKTDNNVGNALSDINNWQPDLNGSVPIGSEVGIYLPDADIATYYPNWLLARGQEVSRTTYPLLFQYLGTTFGAGNGSTTFNLPDTRDKFSVGAGSSYNIGDVGGEDSVAISQAQLPNVSLTGTTNAISHSHYAVTNNTSNNAVMGSQPDLYLDRAKLLGNDLSYELWGSFGNTPNNGVTSSATIQHTITTNALGIGQPHENRPPYLAINRIIRAY